MASEEAIERRRAYQRGYQRTKRATATEAEKAERKAANARWRAANPDKVAENSRRSQERLRTEPELLERARARNRVANMSPEAAEAKRQRGREHSRQKTADAQELGTSRYQIELTAETRAKARRRMREWRAAHPERAAERQRVDTQRYRDKRGPRAAIDTYAYKAIRMALMARDAKSKYFPDFTGRDLKRRFLALMPNGWTFADYGEKWEFDHIEPLTAFEYDSIEDEAYRRCWSLQNLRPLGKAENRAKGGRRTAHASHLSLTPPAAA